MIKGTPTISHLAPKDPRDRSDFPGTRPCRTVTLDAHPRFLPQQGSPMTRAIGNPQRVRGVVAIVAPTGHGATVLGDVMKPSLLERELETREDGEELACELARHLQTIER